MLTTVWWYGWKWVLPSPILGWWYKMFICVRCCRTKKDQNSGRTYALSVKIPSQCKSFFFIHHLKNYSFASKEMLSIFASSLSSCTIPEISKLIFHSIYKSWLRLRMRKCIAPFLQTHLQKTKKSFRWCGELGNEHRGPS